METKEYFFQKLTPTDEADISVYEEAIDFALKNNDITNVAISGAYSAGKSSVIESYKKSTVNSTLYIYHWHILGTLMKKM